MKQIYKITYPTGKIYIAKDSVGSHRYFGSPDMHLINKDFMNLPEEVRKDYTVRKQILWESQDCAEAEISAKEVEFIRKYNSNDPEVGYNRWPKFNADHLTNRSEMTKPSRERLDPQVFYEARGRNDNFGARLTNCKVGA